MKRLIGFKTKCVLFLDYIAHVMTVRETV